MSLGLPFGCPCPPGAGALGLCFGAAASPEPLLSALLLVSPTHCSPLARRIAESLALCSPLSGTAPHPPPLLLGLNASGTNVPSPRRHILRALGSWFHFVDTAQLASFLKHRPASPRVLDASGRIGPGVAGGLCQLHSTPGSPSS